jgi:DNA-binding transcriptional LysR family regulator
MTIPCSLADLQLLSYIAINGSYRGVSRMTGLAHTTVSRRINRLEPQLGIPVIQPDTHPMMLTPWAARLIQSCDLQIAQIRDTITEAQLDFDQTRTIAIDETLLDLAPHLFSVIEAFKRVHTDVVVTPRAHSKSNIRYQTSLSGIDHSLSAHHRLEWAVFAHRGLRYDIQRLPLFRSVNSPMIESLQVAAFSSVEEVATCNHVLQLALHRQGLGLLPLGLAEMTTELVEVTVEHERILDNKLLTLASEFRIFPAHLSLFEQLASHCRTH